MKRLWKETVSPKQLNDFAHCYRGTWMPQMDRCWMSDDGYQVTSRILFTEWGKVEHAAITKITYDVDDSIEDIVGSISGDGSRDILWNVKQQIKNELFGKDRVAIEVFPAESHLIDVADTYHLWIMPKGFKMPFGIHPEKDIQCKPLNRGVPSNPAALAKNYEKITEIQRNNRGEE